MIDAKMVTRADRLAEFTTDTDPASQTLVEVLCEDHVGTDLPAVLVPEHA